MASYPRANPYHAYPVDADRNLVGTYDRNEALRDLKNRSASPYASSSFRPPMNRETPVSNVAPVANQQQTAPMAMPQPGLLGGSPIGGGLLAASNVLSNAGKNTLMPQSLGSAIGPALNAFSQGVDADRKAARELEAYNMAKAAAVAKIERNKSFRNQYPKLANLPIEDAAKIIVDREKQKATPPDEFKSPRWFLTTLEKERKNPGSVSPAKLILAKNAYEAPITFTGPDGELNTRQLKLPSQYAKLGQNNTSSESNVSNNESNDGSGGLEIKTLRPGFDKENQKKLDVAMVNFGKLETSIDQFSDLLDEHGIELMPGKTKQKMASAYLSLLMSLKDFLELGVLAGPDMDIIEGLVKNPTELSFENATAGAEGIKAQLGVLKDMVTRYEGVVHERWGVKGKKRTSSTVKPRQEAMLNKRKIYAKNGKWYYADDNKQVGK